MAWFSFARPETIRFMVASRPSEEGVAPKPVPRLCYWQRQCEQGSQLTGPGKRELAFKNKQNQHWRCQWHKSSQDRLSRVPRPDQLAAGRERAYLKRLFPAFSSFLAARPGHQTIDLEIELGCRLPKLARVDRAVVGDQWHPNLTYQKGCHGSPSREKKLSQADRTCNPSLQNQA